MNILQILGQSPPNSPPPGKPGLLRLRRSIASLLTRLPYTKVSSRFVDRVLVETERGVK